MWKCIVKWTEKGRHLVSAQGAPFSTNFIFCNPYSYYSSFFFFFSLPSMFLICHPFLCSVLVPHFQPSLTPLDPFRFLYVFVYILGALFLFLFVTTLSSFFYNFCRPMIPFLFLIWPLNFKYLGALSCLVCFFIGSFSFNLFLLSLTGRHPCVFLFISYFLLISSLFSFSFAYFLSLPFSPLELPLTPLFFPFFLSLSLLLSFSPLLFGTPPRPPGVQAHAMHPPGYATDSVLLPWIQTKIS